MADFAVFLEPDEGFEGGFEGDGGIGDVELVEVDAFEAESVEASVDGLFEMAWAGVVDPLAGSGALPAALGGDDEAVGIGMEGLGDEVLGDVGAVGVGGVNEVDAELDGAAEGGNGGVAVFWGAPDAGAGEAHGSVAEAVYGEVAEGDVSSGGSGRHGGGGVHGVPPDERWHCGRESVRFTRSSNR